MGKIKNRTVVVVGGALLALSVGLFSVRPSTHIATPAAPPPQASSPSQKNNEGHVVADDDDPAGQSPFQIARETLSPPPRTVAATPKSRSPLRTITLNNRSYPVYPYKPMLVPNDTYANQWWETNAKLPATWDIPRGSHETILAIIDTGFALKHDEFANRWHTNQGESGSTTLQAASKLNCTDRGLSRNASCNLVDDDFDNIVDNESGGVWYENPSRLNCSAQGKPLTKDCNRIDDDSNGYVDDTHGWDFINFDDLAQAGELNPNGDGTAHGTIVTGLAAASGNNAKGIAGVDWGTKILPIQALDDDGYGDSWSVHRAIFYALDQGADVINLSLGSEQSDELVHEAVRAALAAGVTVVAASGNDGCDCMVYPAHYPEVVAVGALASNSQPASFSSWGADLDILAPGTQLTSTSWTAGNPSNAYVSNANGTSFAAPIVSGLMTRLLSLQPNATPQQLVAAVTENTNRQSVSTSAVHAPASGFGALDAHKASSRMVIAHSPTQLYAYTPVSKGGFLLPSTPFEPGGDYASVHECAPSSWPSTAIYELKKTGSHFFSTSKAEQQYALTLGYTSGLFGYGCVQQPHDNPAIVRNLSIFQEFRNMTIPR